MKLIIDKSHEQVETKSLKKSIIKKAIKVIGTGILIATITASSIHTNNKIAHIEDYSVEFYKNYEDNKTSVIFDDFEVENDNYSMDKKDLYVVLVSSRTKMGMLIKHATDYEYNHVSVAFSANLEDMYSFARYKEQVPLEGGFIEEDLVRYSKIPPNSKIYRISLNNEDFYKVTELTYSMKKDFQKYIYNTYDAIAFPFGKEVPIKDAFTCFSFANHLFNEASLEQFKTIKELDQSIQAELIYEGPLSNYINLNGRVDHNNYFENFELIDRTIRTLNHFTKLSSKTK